jgi:DNA-binding transcriptional MerR regulator
MLTTSPVLTLGDVAARCGVAVWQVRRLYERGILPPAMRLSRYRVVNPDDLPAIEAALRQVGYLKGESPRGSAA